MTFSVFFYGGTGNLSIQTGPYTNTPFPTNTFPGLEVFSGDGVSLGGVGESLNPPPFGNLPFDSYFISAGLDYDGNSNINHGNLPIGEYVLRIDGTGQTNSGKPRYVGNYSVRLQGGAQFIQVPEPNSILSLFAVGAIASITLVKNNRKQILR